MARICALCQRPPREGEEMRPIRIKEVDQQGVLAEKKLGLYSACMECVEAHRLRMAERTGKEPHEITNNEMC